jgi:predicted component of type VI protein secretion system
MNVALVMFTEKGERRDFAITRNRALIGRNTECDIRVPLGMVSRRHCELVLQNDQAVVRDLGSSNGTYVNNKRIQESALAPGDTLTVGPVIFTAVINGEPKTIKPILTILHRRSGAAGRKPAPVAKDDTGSLDLESSGELEVMANERGGTSVGAGLDDPVKETDDKP